MSTNPTILAGIVTFNPELGRLRENIGAVLPQVECVVVVDNGSENVSQVRTLVEGLDGVVLIALGENRGIAAALNQIGDYAIKAGYEYFLTLDQDSVCMPGMVGDLRSYLNLPDIGLLNTYHVDRNKAESRRENLELVENMGMVTSGSLMQTALFASGFRYDERLFIDKVDIDLNFALSDAGYHMYQIPVCGLLHEMGAISAHRFFWRTVHTYNRSAFRRYYISRNSVLLTKKYGWAKRTRHFYWTDFATEVMTILYEDRKVEKTRSALKGFFDGIRYKM